ncbi:hypothetical protein H2248_002769 [Termitomyces sp. 'cryptogamus']|nr:hypothetical protein H2248_002769 [Termitomyces sp. 'cryptogamus']
MSSTFLVCTGGHKGRGLGHGEVPEAFGLGALETEDISCSISSSQTFSRLRASSALRSSRCLHDLRENIVKVRATVLKRLVEGKEEG